MNQKGSSWVGIILVPYFRLLCPLPLSAMLPGDIPTVTASPTEEKKRKKLSTRTAEDTLQWAVGSGIDDHVSLMDGNAMLVQSRCNICGCWLSINTGVLEVHVWAEIFNKLTARINVDQMRMHRKLENCMLHPHLFGG